MEFDKTEEECLQIDVEELGSLLEFPLEACKIAEETDKDPELRVIRRGLYIRLRVLYVLLKRAAIRSNAKWFYRKDMLACKSGVLLYQGTSSQEW